MHAGSVALVLNPKTGLVSPQYHVVFDDDFSTVPNLRAGSMPENWKILVQNSREKSADDFYDVTKTWFEGAIDPSDTRSEPIVLPTDSRAAEPTIGHYADPIIGQVDQPLSGHDGQPGAGVADSGVSHDDELIDQGGQREADVAAPSVGRSGQPTVGQVGHQGTVVEPCTGQVGQPSATVGQVGQPSTTVGQVGHQGTVVEPCTGQVGQPSSGQVGRPDQGPVVEPCAGQVDPLISGHDGHSTNDKFVSFECTEAGSLMPPMLDLKTAGLRRSPRIAAHEKKPWYKCNVIYK